MSTISASTTSTTAFKITTDTTGALVFQTGASPTTAMTLDTSQNTTLAGNIRLNNGTADGAQLSLASSGYSDWNIDNYSGNFRWYYNATEYMRLDNAGNLGIGVSPSAWGSSFKAIQIGAQTTLSYYGQSSVLSNNVYNDNSNWKFISSNHACLYQQYTATGFHAWYTTATAGTAEGTASLTQAMTLDASGNLGVGTTSPAYKLHVVGGQARIDVSAASTSLVCLGTGSNFQVDHSTSGYATLVNSANSGAAMIFKGSSESMRIDTSGNLLVGTSSFTTGGINKTVVVSSSGSAGFQLADGTSVASFIYWYSTTGFRVETTASYPKVEFAPGGSGGVQLASAGATSWTTLSDENTKTDLVPITDAAEKVATLRAVTGRFKTDEVGKSRAFLIAQDVLSVLPEAVSPYTEKDGTEHLGLSYTEVIPLLVAAIKELNAKVTALENK